MKLTLLTNAVISRDNLEDTIDPTVVISSSESVTTLLSPFPITITFAEDVTGFVVGDLTVGNGTAGNFQTVNGSLYTADITPDVAGAVTVDIDADVCVDVAGNGNAAATQFSITYIGA